MGKGLFAIVLVAASFAGGAVVNGPGLRWARDLILNHPGDEIATTTLGDPPPPESDASDALEPIAEIPSTPIPPLVVTPEATPGAIDPVAQVDPAQPQPQSPAPGAAPNASELPRPKAPDPPRPQVSREKATGPLDPQGIAPVAVPAAIDPIAAESPAAIEPPAPLTTSKDQDGAPPERPIAAAGPVDPEVALASLAPGSKGPGPHPAPTSASPAPPGGPATDDWAAIRSQMRALGVARYGIDGDPAGRVRFHCVIPLAGQRAVGQQFEAEGGDAIEAARTALRRVALWRATEHPAP